MSFVSNANSMTKFEDLPEKKKGKILSRITNLITGKETKFQSYPDYVIIIATAIDTQNWIEIASANEQEGIPEKAIVFSYVAKCSIRKSKNDTYPTESTKFDRVIFKRLPLEIELLLACINRASFDMYREFLGLSNEYKENQ